MKSTIYILLPVHNRRQITEKFIDSLCAQTYEHYHLLLIDDGSTDGTADMVRSKVPSEKVTVIRGEGEWWWAGSLQQGIDWLRKHDVKSSDIVLMINDDVTYEPDFLENGMKYICRHPKSLLLAREYDVEKDRIIETGVNVNFRHMTFRLAEQSDEINCLSTRGLFLRWDVLERIGNFHPVLLPHYGSDYEYTIRAGRRGLTLATVENVFLVPNHSATGVREYAAESVVDEIKVMFSKRCVYNPVYWTSLILLAFPLRYIPLHLIRIWAGAASRLLKSLRRQVAIWRV